MDLTTGNEWIHHRANYNPLEVLNFELDRTEYILYLYYNPTTSRSFFDVCMPTGTVVHTQALEHEPMASWHYGGLPKGEYQLFVVDGDNMMRYQFTI